MRGSQRFPLVLLLSLAFTAACGTPVQRQPLLLASQDRLPASGPLRTHPANPRYFADGSGRAVYLTGSHTWNNFQDWGAADPPPAFDYPRYLDFLQQHGHNFIRLYVWEQAWGVPWSRLEVRFAPLPYLRTGPGQARDGGPKFDLRRFNPSYFDRLRERVRAAQLHGIYVSVMLFNGWSIESKRSATARTLGSEEIGNPWLGHPFHRDNNVNGIDGDMNGDGEGFEVHTLANPAVTQLQKAYLRKVIDTLNDLDNVLWEISNESTGGSQAWQYEMIRFIQSYEASLPKQHPTGMTVEFPDGSNSSLLHSPAQWISPRPEPSSPYDENPPPATGEKIIIADTDHIWGIGGSPAWVWMSFTRGLNPIFMDPYQTNLIANFFPMFGTPSVPREPWWEEVRRAMGFTRRLAQQLDLASLLPQPHLASTGYCLARPGAEYLVYIPPRRRYRWIAPRVTVDLSAARGPLQVEWIHPATGERLVAGTIPGGGRVFLIAPFRNPDAVLHLSLNPAP